MELIVKGELKEINTLIEKSKFYDEIQGYHQYDMCKPIFREKSVVISIGDWEKLCDLTYAIEY